MGLDLVLYTAKNVENDGEELAYGRKTWAIEQFFERRCDTVQPYEYIFEVTEAAWNEFIDNLSPYLKNETFRDFIKEYDDFDEGASEELDNIIEGFLDEALENDNPYTLGPAWEAHAVVEWYDADAEVRACFEEDEPVWLLASY